jgi:hypothetical protein
LLFRDEIQKGRSAMFRKRLSVCLLSTLGATAVVLTAATAANPDKTKREIERPAQTVAARTAPVGEENPSVAPGKVTWHASFEAACEASKKSGKPVLLFQLLGHLDKQFC